MVWHINFDNIKGLVKIKQFFSVSFFFQKVVSLYSNNYITLNALQFIINCVLCDNFMKLMPLGH